MAGKGLTDIAGLRVGHASDLDGITGCTVILCGPQGAVAGVDVRGSAVGEREMETLRVGHLVERIHALVLAGGSAFGLEAAGGAVRYLEEQGIGFDTGVAKVPIVPAAILFDLGIGDSRRRPDSAMGYQAAQRASDAAVEEGSVGAGTGATVGKLFGSKQATKGGLGTATQELPGGVAVSALAVVNAFGDVRDPAPGDGQHHRRGAGGAGLAGICRHGGPNEARCAAQKLWRFFRATHQHYPGGSGHRCRF
jgi:L-aminopeptidase/D-esterase-like protein